MQAGITAGDDSRAPFFYNVWVCCRSCGHSNKDFLYTLLGELCLPGKLALPQHSGRVSAGLQGMAVFYLCLFFNRSLLL